MMATATSTHAHVTPTPSASASQVHPSASASPIQQIRAEYLEMPGLTLTVPQAARLWGLNASQSERLLSELAGSGFLIRDARGAYRRRGCPRCS